MLNNSHSKINSEYIKIMFLVMYKIVLKKSNIIPSKIDNDEKYFIILLEEMADKSNRL